MLTLPTRKFAFTALALAFLLVALFALPSVRSFAAGVLNQIGVIRLSSEPSLAERLAAGETTVYDPPAGPEVRPTIPAPAQLTLPEAAAQAEFGVADINPPAGYELSTRTVYGDGSFGNGSEALIQTIYLRDLGNGRLSFISLEQARYSADGATLVVEQKIGQAPVIEVTVRGHAGLFVEQAHVIAVPDESSGEWQSAGVNILIWEEDGFTFTLTSNALTLEEMTAMAAGMTR